MEEDAVMVSENAGVMVEDSVIVCEDVELKPIEPLTEMDIVAERVPELDFRSLADIVIVGLTDVVIDTELMIDGRVEGVAE